MTIDINKDIFLKTMLRLRIPNTYQSIIDKIVDDTIYWNIKYDEIAPWKPISQLIKSKGIYEILFTTENMKTESSVVKLNVKLILSDIFLKFNKIVIKVEPEIISEGNKIEKLIFLYQIDQNNNLTMTSEDRRLYTKAISNLFNKYAIYPSIVNYMIMWLHEFVSMVLNEIHSNNSHGGGNNNYEYLYNKYKSKYLKLKNMQ